MPRKPVDPLIARVAAAGAAAPVAHGITSLAGLPDCPHWRALRAGELTRPGDHIYVREEQRWQAVPAEAVSSASEGVVIWRPMGDSMQKWWVGHSAVSAQFRDGSPDRPWATLAEALSSIKDSAVGL